MPLIIQELVTTVETPAEAQQQSWQSVGAQDSEKKAVEHTRVNTERQERLSID